MNRVIEMHDKDKLVVYSRKSSMGVSDDDLVSMTENKFSRKLLTTKFKAEDFNTEKKEKNIVAVLVQK